MEPVTQIEEATVAFVVSARALQDSGILLIVDKKTAINAAIYGSAIALGVWSTSAMWKRDIKPLLTARKERKIREAQQKQATGKDAPETEKTL